MCAAEVYAMDPKCLQFYFGRGANKRLVNANHPLGLHDAFNLIGHLEGFECIKLMKLIQSSVLLDIRPTVFARSRFEQGLRTVVEKLPRRLVVKSRLHSARKIQLRTALK